MKKRYCFSLFIAAILFSGCDPEEQIPAYVSIPAIRLQTDYSTQGTNSNAIKDAWVYIDNNLLGVYELPARFPVLAEGSHKITIGAGVFENGITATRIHYPFYDSYETIAEFKPGEDVVLPDTIDVRYFSGITFNSGIKWYEDFEGNIINFGATSDNTALIDSKHVPNHFEDANGGIYSAQYTLDATHNVLSVEYVGATHIDINNFNEVYLELNYKSEQRFNVGAVAVYSNSASTHYEYALTVNASEDWHKVYVHMSNIFGSNPQAINFKVSIAALLEDGRTSSTIYVDNIKLVYN